jgi:hypothetical protein
LLARGSRRPAHPTRSSLALARLRGCWRPPRAPSNGTGRAAPQRPVRTRAAGRVDECIDAPSPLVGLTGPIGHVRLNRVAARLAVDVLALDCHGGEWGVMRPNGGYHTTAGRSVTPVDHRIGPRVSAGQALDDSHEREWPADGAQLVHYVHRLLAPCRPVSNGARVGGYAPPVAIHEIRRERDADPEPPSKQEAQQAQSDSLPSHRHRRQSSGHLGRPTLPPGHTASRDPDRGDGNVGLGRVPAGPRGEQLEGSEIVHVGALPGPGCWARGLRAAQRARRTQGARNSAPGQGVAGSETNKYGATASPAID